MTPLYEQPHPELCLENVYAVDCETTLIKEPQYACNSRTRISPPSTPDLVLGSVAGAGSVAVYSANDLGDWLELVLADSKFSFVFHNSAFDCFVLGRARPVLTGLINRAVDEGRIHDTMLMEVLIQIARGSRTVSQKELIRSPRLADLAKRRCGIELNKGDIRVGFGQYAGRCDLVPKDYCEYAARDAVATYRVYQSQQVELTKGMGRDQHCRYPVYPEAERRFGQLSERIQIAGALAFAWLEQFPLRVDLQAARDYSARLEAEAARLQNALLHFELARRTPKTKKFSVRNKHLRGLLKTYCEEHELVPEYSDSGLLSLKYDFWAEYLPRLTAAQTANPMAAETLEERLAVWMRYCRIERLFVRYLRPYSAAERHYPRYFNIGARTGRSSATCPPVQQIPKRRDGIRNLFIPEEGNVFIEGDFAAAELVALAQTYLSMYGTSTLADALNQGFDPHIALARRLSGDFDSLSDTERKQLRQAAKAINFGLPGGLGAAKFGTYAHRTYGLQLTTDQARSLRLRALSVDPQLQRYLEDSHTPDSTIRLAAKNLGLSLDQLVTELRCWQDQDLGRYNELLAVRRLRMFKRGVLPWPVPTPPGFDSKYDLFKDVSRTLTGRLRGQASYTEAHNFPFQGLVADAVKVALWNLYKVWLADPWFSPVTSVHDSILAQGPAARRRELAAILQETMSSAMSTICPDVRGGVDVTDLGTAWGRATGPEGEAV